MQSLLGTLRVNLCRHFSGKDAEQACQLVSQLTQEGGEVIMKALIDKPKFTTKKHARDLLTQTDGAVEQVLVRGIRKQFPNHKIIAEEGSEGTSECRELNDDTPTWIIDPIDGTMNFVHGFPHFCISIGLYVEKKGVLGWIYNPLLQQSYSVQRGQGVRLNGEVMRVSGQCELNKSLICLEWPSRLYEKTINVSEANFRKLLPIAHGVRSLGSTALNIAHVATGACDAYIQFDPHIWDLAAGVLMVQEAGGVVIDPCGGEFDIHSRRLLAAATPELANQIVPLLTQLFPLEEEQSK